jgi:hypothetical protein
MFGSRLRDRLDNMGHETHSKRKPSYPAFLHLVAYGFAIALPLVLVLGALLFIL